MRNGSKVRPAREISFDRADVHRSTTGGRCAPIPGAPSDDGSCRSILCAVHRIDVAALVGVHGGAATTGMLRGLGVPRSALERALADGSIRRIGHGVLAVSDASPAHVLAARTRSVPTCVTALKAAGVDLVEQPTKPHLLTTHRRSERGAVWHRDRLDLPRDDLVAATLRAAGCLPEREGLAAIDSVLFRGLLDRGDLIRHAPRGARQVRWVVNHGDGGAESVLESLLRHQLLRAGIDGLELQAQLPGVGRVDLLVHGWLVLEADGHAFHSDRAAIRRDNARSVTALTDGYLTMRFGYEQLRYAPDTVQIAVEKALARGRKGRFRTREQLAP